MSRSRNTEARNPAVRFFEWKGDDGRIQYYDKELKENIVVPIPFTFLVLDKLATLTGYSDDLDSGFWSNEIRNTKRDKFTLRTKRGVYATDFYENLKGVKGVKYANSVYIAFYDENKQLQIGNFKFSGCGGSAWIEFTKGLDLYKFAITINGKVEGSKGKTVYYSPTFKTNTVSEETNAAALELDKTLQEYLDAYFALQHDEPPTPDYRAERDAELNDYKEDHAHAAAASGNPPSWSGVDENGNDDIPFALLASLGTVAVGMMAMAHYFATVTL